MGHPALEVLGASGIVFAPVEKSRKNGGVGVAGRTAGTSPAARFAASEHAGG
jgi:hypothetical protein